MNLKRRVIGVGAIVVLLFVLTIFQLQAQTPTATPATGTGTATPTSHLATETPLPITPLPTRQAVVKNALDGDSVEVVFTDNGQVATVHLADVRSPESVGDIECFGREAAEYAVQSYQSNPLITIEPVGEIENDELSAYVTLADGTLLNEILVLFGYARFDGQIQSTYTERIQSAEEQSKKGKTGLWRVCGETAKAPKPCFIFANGELDSSTKRSVIELNPDQEISVSFRTVYYDPVQQEIIVTWLLYLNSRSSGHRVREYFRTSDCLRDRSEVFNTLD